MPAPQATAGGWAIHGDEIIDISGRRVRVDENVPYAEVSPSPDGYFCDAMMSNAWTMISTDTRHQYIDGVRRCLFATAIFVSAPVAVCSCLCARTRLSVSALPQSAGGGDV